MIPNNEQSRVLVVEDHPVSRRILEAMLRQTCTVISADSGEEAIRLAQETAPDLVLLDIEMPDMDGFQTMERLRNGIIESSVPVIFITAREDSASRERGLQIGAVDYITKPYDRQELTIKVKNHLALYAARKEIETKNKIMLREMEMASQLQNSLLPQIFPTSDALCLNVVYRPYSRAGGDFFDFIDLGELGTGVVVVDVSGHGVAAAMIGAMFKMAFQSFARHESSPCHVLARINDEMVRVLPESDFLTVFYGIFSPANLGFRFCNAGHPRPFLYRRSLNSIELLHSGGPLIGAFPEMDYEDDLRILHSGDQILIFTDGVTEAITGKDQEEYGEERLRKVFLKNLSLPPADILNSILADLETFCGNNKFQDDVTLMLLSVE